MLPLPPTNSICSHLLKRLLYTLNLYLYRSAFLIDEFSHFIHNIYDGVQMIRAVSLFHIVLLCCSDSSDYPISVAVSIFLSLYVIFIYKNFFKISSPSSSQIEANGRYLFFFLLNSMKKFIFDHIIFSKSHER